MKFLNKLCLYILLNSSEQNLIILAPLPEHA